MQQQSQIFVFSTNLANKAAESVLQGQFQTIIAFHCSQPGTKKFLEVRTLSLLLALNSPSKTERQKRQKRQTDYRERERESATPAWKWFRIIFVEQERFIQSNNS